jgi:diguanylate cyclase (GGDEF)-like protein
MERRTTYQKLILKIILITLVVTLALGFIYAQIIKQESIEKLAKVDAKKTTKLIFESLYSAMSRGWTKDDLNNIILRINQIDEGMIVNTYRSETVALEHGEVTRDKYARQNNDFIKQAFKKNEILNVIDEDSIQYYYPIIATKECLHCHLKTKQGEVLGVIDITYPVDDLKISLSSILNLFPFFIISFSLVIFLALFINFNKYLVNPIILFIKKINDISNNKDLSERITLNNDIEEIHSMQNVFNNMLDTLEYQFYNDELTALPNRKRLIELTSKPKQTAILMILNIDKFQEINALYGDKVGNSILKNTANIIKQNIPPKATLYKLHADEYALYCKSQLEYEEIKELASQLTDIVENNTITINGSEIFINATIGIAFGENFLFQNADIALKLAKKKKEKYLIYDSSMNIEYEYEQNLKWTRKIKDAIDKNKIEPVFQPIVNTKTQKIVKYEALIRMLDDEGNHISPIHFLDLAKKNKLYPQLTSIMIDKTFKRFENSSLQVSINLSVEDILNVSVNKLIIQSLKKYNFKDRIIFEILESEGIENFDKVLEFIKEVKTLGAQISIDDFGTGYSNFEYLMKLQVDYIKIDASMIRDIDTNKNSQMVTETIIDFAKKMNIKTVAEFIHSENVYKKVKEIGIDYSQGYYFGEPVKDI